MRKLITKDRRIRIFSPSLPQMQARAKTAHLVVVQGVIFNKQQCYSRAASEISVINYYLPFIKTKSSNGF